jgi:hypothetical protein
VFWGPTKCSAASIHQVSRTDKCESSAAVQNREKIWSSGLRGCESESLAVCCLSCLRLAGPRFSENLWQYRGRIQILALLSRESLVLSNL